MADAPKQPMQPIEVEGSRVVAVPIIDEADFELRLPVFTGPLGLLLHLIESRELDVLTVPLVEVADAYVEYLATHPVDPEQLGDFVATAAQLIYLKSKRLLPGEPLPPLPEGTEEPDEEELRRRLIEYRELRDASVALAELDGVAPVMRREPRESDLPELPAEPLAPELLAEAIERLAAIPEPEPPPPEVVPRQVTIGQQIAVLLAAVSETGRVMLHAVLAASRSRAEATVTFLAMLELVRRRQIRAQQRTLFGPILLEIEPKSR